MNLKKLIPDAMVILFFVAISMLYFITPIRDGLVLNGHDHSAADGISVEMEQYRKEHNGERTRWTNALFCGMPTYQISPSYPSTQTLSFIESIYKLGLPTVASYVFMMLLGFYIMLRAFNFRVWMAALGAILWAFSSYYFIIIAAGHIWKLLTLSFIPPTIGGMVLCYRGRYLWGIVLTGLFTALQILSNHVQMTYYFLFVMAFMVLAFFIDALRKHTLQQWTRATMCFVLGSLLGVCINLSNLVHTWQYSKESMRGKSELTQKVKDPKDQTSSGLERSYITMWSYGLGETWTLLVPNTKGGASIPLSQSSTAMEKANPMFTPIYQAFTQYWGEQPGTSGPVYVGAFVLTLFFLGLFIVNGPIKWCLLAATVLSILLSWGKNFMGFTDFFLDYVPMYDKFRTVASILVIAEFTIPLLAMLALKELVDNPECLKGKDGRMPKIHYLSISFALTGGVALLFWLIPDVFFGQYLSSMDLYYMQQYAQAGYIPQEMTGSIIQNMSEMRRAMFTADAMRSFIVVLVGTLVVLAYHFKRVKTLPMVGCLIILCLFDMWGVNKRYLNDEMFVRPKQKEQEYPMTAADKQILKDTDPYHRVLNLTVSTFNDNSTSVYHKNIGGYHPAKLRRYQEIIEEHLQHEIQQAKIASITHGFTLDSVCTDTITPVLNMLNMKYMILPSQKNEPVAVRNNGANGNAWMVDHITYVNDADSEIKALHQMDTKHKAVADKKFQKILGEAIPGSQGHIKLTHYEANELAYEVDSEKGGVAVFSEIYYPEWTCLVDGKDTEIGRVNYVLRAIRLEPGKHTVVFRFHPQSIKTTEAVAYGALAILAIILLILCLLPLYQRTKHKE